MNEEIWESVSKAIRNVQDAPAWLVRQLDMGYPALMQLPILDQTNSGQDARPSVSERILQYDYIQFLCEQIALAPRGPEWTAILQARVEALSPFVGQSLIKVSFFCLPAVAWIEIDPRKQRVICVEVT